jgi:hypothetical protein
MELGALIAILSVFRSEWTESLRRWTAYVVSLSAHHSDLKAAIESTFATGRTFAPPFTH